MFLACSIKIIGSTTGGNKDNKVDLNNNHALTDELSVCSWHGKYFPNLEILIEEFDFRFCSHGILNPESNHPAPQHRAAMLARQRNPLLVAKFLYFI